MCRTKKLILWIMHWGLLNTYSVAVNFLSFLANCMLCLFLGIFTGSRLEANANLESHSFNHNQTLWTTCKVQLPKLWQKVGILCKFSIAVQNLVIQWVFCLEGSIFRIYMYTWENARATLYMFQTCWLHKHDSAWWYAVNQPCWDSENCELSVLYSSVKQDVITDVAKEKERQQLRVSIVAPGW